MHWIECRRSCNALYAYRVYSCFYYVTKILPFLTRPAVNIAMNPYLTSQISLSRARVTIVWTLWRHQQSSVTSSAKRMPSEWNTGWCVEIVVLPLLMDSLCHVRNTIMYVLSWRTVYVSTRVLYWCVFLSSVRNSGNKHNKANLRDLIAATGLVILLKLD